MDDSSDGGDAPTSLADKAKGLFSFLKKKGDGAESPIMEKLHTPISKRVPLTWMHVVVIGIILLLLMVFVHYTRCKPRLCTTGCTASKQYRSHTTVWKPARHRGRKPADK